MNENAKHYHLSQSRVGEVTINAEDSAELAKTIMLADLAFWADEADQAGQPADAEEISALAEILNLSAVEDGWEGNAGGWDWEIYACGDEGVGCSSDQY